MLHFGTIVPVSSLSFFPLVPEELLNLLSDLSVCTIKCQHKKTQPCSPLWLSLTLLSHRLVCPNARYRLQISHYPSIRSGSHLLSTWPRCCKTAPAALFAPMVLPIGALSRTFARLLWAIAPPPLSTRISAGNG